jgi:hypothetical protein
MGRVQLELAGQFARNLQFLERRQSYLRAELGAMKRSLPCQQSDAYISSASRRRGLDVKIGSGSATLYSGRTWN